MLTVVYEMRPNYFYVHPRSLLLAVLKGLLLFGLIAGSVFVFRQSNQRYLHWPIPDFLWFPLMAIGALYGYATFLSAYRRLAVAAGKPVWRRDTGRDEGQGR